jgi:hypothetical protein
MGKRDGQQKGAQTHAEGQHGAKAHARFIESLHEGGERHQEAESEAEKKRLDRK